MLFFSEYSLSLFQWGFTSCKADQPLRGIQEIETQLQEIETHKG